MTHDGSLETGRQAFTGQAWSTAFDGLTAADVDGELGLDDLERLAVAADLSGHGLEATRAWERANREALRLGLVARAARAAFHLVMGFGQRGDMAQAGAWHSRASRALDDAGLDVVERGYLLVPEALAMLQGGDAAGALERFERVAAHAARFDDLELATFGRLGRGQCLITLGSITAGVALLDEAMIAVTTGEVSPTTAGTVYCASIEAFGEVFDLRRAQEWTAALTAWCDAQPDLVPFRGRCLVYRAELLQFHGSWDDADREAQRAQDWLSRPPIEPALGEAMYQRAELHRLRGDHRAAEDAYGEASRWGRRPDPGLALLRSAQGDRTAATASIRRALDEAEGPGRTRLLEPCVEIMLAAGDIDAAARAAAELGSIAAASGASLLLALAARADGCVRLARGDPKAALSVLRQAEAAWQELGAPYEVARVRELIAAACRAIGDEDGAALESAAARRIFEELGARPDLDRLALLDEAPAERPGGLTDREIEVLRLVAGGHTNKQIAGSLGISERTVDRHVSNLLAKLEVPSRSAATAFAYEHGLT